MISNDSSPVNKSVIPVAIFIFVIACIARFTYIETADFFDPIRADAQKYFLLAMNLMHFGAYSMDIEPPRSATVTITPGYPFFLAPFLAVSSSVETFFRTVLAAQALIGSLTVLTLYLISARVLPFIWATCFGVVVSLIPHHIVFGGYLLTETLFTALLTLSIYFLIRHIESHASSWLILAGLTCGAAALTRPAALLLMPFIAAILVYVGTIRWPKALLVVAVSVLTWMPWQIWSSLSVEKSTEQHSQFAAVFAFGSYPDFIFKTESMRGYPYREDPEYPVMSSSSSKAISIVLERAKAEPFRYLYWYTAGKPMTFWSWNMMESVGGPFIYPVGHNIWMNSQAGQILLAIYHGLHRLLLLVGAPVLIMILWNTITRRTVGYSQKPTLIIACLLIVYFTSIHQILAAWPRYSVPFWPFFYLLGFWGLFQVGAIWRRASAASESKDDHL